MPHGKSIEIPDKGIFIKEMREVSSLTPDHYNSAYPSFIRFFESRSDNLKEDDFVLAANFIYGWMPRILRLGANKGDWLKATKILSKARHQQIADTQELDLLRKLLGNSLVAASKILHFASPNLHPIWDRRVCRYLRKNISGAGVDSTNHLLRYFEICTEISSWLEVKKLLPSFQKNYGRLTTLCRAIELTMFVKGKRIRSQSMRRY